MSRVDDSRALAMVLHERLLARAQTAGCAESLTGGALADLLSGTPGASATFVGGVVSYATSVKRTVLGVTAELVVSAECAEQMATGARDLLGADWVVATTGVAGPTEQDGQPVGTVYVGLAGPAGASSSRHSFSGDRTGIRRQACVAALEEVLDAL